jgi:hypothetical protein
MRRWRLRGLTDRGFLVFSIVLSVVSYRVIHWLEPDGLSFVASSAVEIGLIVAVAIPLYLGLLIRYATPATRRVDGRDRNGRVSDG